MRLVLAADIGSTFTKLTAVDLESRKIIGSARSFTTIDHNVMDGYEDALAELTRQCGRLEFETKAAASSAAGGLKMVAIGLVPDLTVQAARLAAANAGAKIMKTYAFELSGDEIAEILALNPDIILLSGGIDGGNKEVIIYNARLLAASGLACPVVAAGNKSASDELKKAFAGYPGEVLFRPNVMPDLNKLDIEPARQAIGDLFVKNIVRAKGLTELQNKMSGEIIPTPLAVFLAAELLSRGLKKAPGLGELMVFDVGGATTDVYSMAEGRPTRPNVVGRGLRQPFAKRTVEGDLGLRYSLAPLAEATDLESLAETLECGPEALEQWFAGCRKNPGLIPEAGSLQKKIDDEMAASAVKISMERHTGYLETVYTVQGISFVQSGKDLGPVAYVIGTGGPIIGSSDPARVLGQAVYRPEDLNLLKPLSPRLVVDRKYILSAMGSISRFEPEAALSIMLDEIPAGSLPKQPEKRDDSNGIRS